MNGRRWAAGFAAACMPSVAAGSPVNTAFDAGLDGSTTRVDGVGPVAGAVVAIDGGAELREGGAFLVVLEQMFDLPQGASVLRLDAVVLIRSASDPSGLSGVPDTDSAGSGEEPGLDPADRAFPDVFEVHLVDDLGQPLLAPWGGDASAVLSVQEGGAVYAGLDAAYDGQTVTLDVSALPAGATVTLRLVLVGADQDTRSVVRVDDSTSG